MFAIYRRYKTGRVSNKVLATGDSPESAWGAFNNKQVYRNYNENALFVCMVLK